MTPSSYYQRPATRGKQGKVLAVSPKEGKVIVEGRNMVTKHVKPRKMGEQGGIVKAEGAHVCQQGAGCLPPLRQAHPRRRTRCTESTAQKERVCKQNCGETL